MADGKTDKIIEVRGLKNQFGSQVVHEDLNLDVYRGEVLGIVGGSGTGKSVLLRSIVGLNTPAEGTITVFGLNLRELSDDERRLAERRWGVLFQEGALFSGLTVAQNIQVPLREHLRLPQDLWAHLRSYLHLLDSIRASEVVEKAALWRERTSSRSISPRRS